MLSKEELAIYEPHNLKRFDEMPSWERIIWLQFLARWREECRTSPLMKPQKDAPPLKAQPSHAL